MPSTKRAAGAGPRMRPIDYEFEFSRLRALNLGPDVTLVAETYIGGLRTKASTRSGRQTLGSCLRELAAMGVSPLEATPHELVRWWNTTMHYAPRSRLTRLTTLRRFYQTAKRLNLVGDDPTWAMTPVRSEVLTPTPGLTQVQAEELIESVRAEFSHPDRGLQARRDFAVIALALRMCLRAAEIAGLRWENITEDHGERTARFLGKFQKIATLSVPDDVWDALVAWRTAFERESGVRMQQRDPVVVSLSNAAFRAAIERRDGIALEPLAPTMISTIAMNRLGDIGLTSARMAAHALRATGATMARRGGADLLELQKLLRHSKLDTTRLYLKEEDEHARPAMELMPLRLGGDSAKADES